MYVKCNFTNEYNHNTLHFFNGKQNLYLDRNSSVEGRFRKMIKNLLAVHVWNFSLIVGACFSLHLLLVLQVNGIICTLF